MLTTARLLWCREARLRDKARLQGMGSVCLLMEGWQCGSDFIAWKTNVMEVLASDPLGDRGGVQGGVSQFRT